MVHSKAAKERRKADGKDLGKRKAAQARDAPVIPTGPHDGCCRPVPDARFVDEALVSVHKHHIGRHCGGYMEPYNMDEWWKEVRDSVNAKAKADSRGRIREPR